MQKISNRYKTKEDNYNTRSNTNNDFKMSKVKKDKVKKHLVKLVVLIM